ncbi:hypothetical protein HNP84_007950 [Thermocatellispora tengchongensis]|uniref:Immunity protein 35 domain-containing protein n=1 Tax=Thermocatellispora tengchongensis TaxID=1073253 RepID=A0A840PMC9_9ACTN|nr:hypothetical protein [Thermocatellispora tengchongensis]MBB5138197.1 hypothetical protein [Thermocatellispora tengchongensis]
MNPDQARAIAEEYFNGVRPLDQALTVVVHPFPEGHPSPEGYVAWALVPEPADPRSPPEVVGSGCIVIDAATGEVAIRPLLNPEIVAAQWPGPR